MSLTPVVCGQMELLEWNERVNGRNDVTLRKCRYCMIILHFFFFIFIYAYVIQERGFIVCICNSKAYSTKHTALWPLSRTPIRQYVAEKHFIDFISIFDFNLPINKVTTYI